MGMIVDQPENESVNHNWALVSNGVVSNVIVANLNFINTIQDYWDYLVDITNGGNSANAGPGSTYDPETDTFSLPPIDYVAQLAAALIEVSAAMNAALADSEGMSPEDITSAIDTATGNVSPGFTENQSSVWTDICDWVSSGG